jgi:hypothetical protein
VLRSELVPNIQEVEDDRHPRWDTPSSTPKKEWKSTISTMKRTASILTEPVELAPFRLSLFLTCLLPGVHILRCQGANGTRKLALISEFLDSWHAFI